MKKILFGLVCFMVCMLFAVATFAATPYDRTVGAGSLSTTDTGKIATVKIAIDTTAATGTVLVADDTVKLMIIPAGYLVESVNLIVGTAEGSASTLDIGDSAACDTYLNGGDINAAAGTMLFGDGAASSGITTVAYKKYYNTANYIILKCIDGNSAFKGTVIVTLVKCTI